MDDLNARLDALAQRYGSNVGDRVADLEGMQYGERIYYTFGALLPSVVEVAERHAHRRPVAACETCMHLEFALAWIVAYKRIHAPGGEA